MTGEETRDEFITNYMHSRGVDPSYRTADGYKLPDRASRFAAPCDCGEAYCTGWAMEYADDDPVELRMLAEAKARARDEQPARRGRKAAAE